MMREMEVHLLLACENGDLEKVVNCIEIGGVRANTQCDRYQVQRLARHPIYNMDGATPLFIACLNKRSQIVRYLIERGANASAGLSASLAQNAGLTPLHAAFHSVKPNLESAEQLDIIRCLVEAGADPSALSSEGIPIWMVDKNHFYRTHEPCLVSHEAWFSPRAVALLIQLGMSVTQRCPVGRTLFHFVAGPALMDDAEVFNLLLEKGADLNARDNEGITPIMAAAIGHNQLPNIAILKLLAERKEIPNMDKIDALEVAAAVLLSYLNSIPPREDYNNRYEDIVNFLSLAKTLRLHENCTLKAEEEKIGWAVESFTSLDDFGQIQQRSSDYEIQSILMRLRIFSSINWRAVRRYLFPFIDDYCRKLDTERKSDRTLDVCWKVLETTRSFDIEEKGIYLATVSVVELLLNTLHNLHNSNDPLFNIETLETSLDLLVATYQVIPPAEEFHSSVVYLHDFYYFLLMLDVLPIALKTPRVTALVKDIISKNGSCSTGRKFLHIATKESSAEKIFERVVFLVRNGANADAVDYDGNGPLHFLAKVKNNSVQHQAAARLLLENGAHLDRANREGKTAADIWPEEMEIAFRPWNDEPIVPARFNIRPEWLNEGVPLLKCLAARVARRQDLHVRVLNEDGSPKFPATLIDFVEIHQR